MRDRGHVQLPDQPELYGNRDTRAEDAWGDFLHRYPAHWFTTLTWRREKFFTDKHTGEVRSINRTGHNGSIHPEAAAKGFRLFISSINRQLYGAQWARRWHRGLQWVYGQEFHRDGCVHLHALVSAATDDLNHLTSRYHWHEWWFREFGRNQIEQPRSQQEVADYVSKYVAKGGAIEFSNNFGAWLPSPPDFSKAVTRQPDMALSDQHD